MSAERAPAALIGGVGLLERAINYALGCLRLVTPQDLRRSTPCSEWDLRELLAHMNDSLVALHEAVQLKYVDVSPRADEGSTSADPVQAFRDAASVLLGAYANTGTDATISIGGCRVTTSIVTGTGALELTVHGWDMAQALGVHRPIPPRLADELLPLAELLITGADRPGRFAAPVRVPPAAAEGDRLVAFLGRRP